MKKANKANLRSIKSWIPNVTSWALVLIITLSSIAILIQPQVKATNGGQIIFYLRKERSDANETYNSLSYSPYVQQSLVASGATSTTAFNSASPAFCQSADNTSDKFNQISASAATTGEKCMATFISPKIGKQITFNTTDSSTSFVGSVDQSKSANATAANAKMYIYRWTGSGNPATSDLLATLSCTAASGTGINGCGGTAPSAAPANNITLTAGQRIVAIVTMNVTSGAGNGRTVSIYFDCNGASCNDPSNIGLAYTSPAYNNTNAPATFNGTLDDDFTTAAGATSCTTAGVIYNTKWTCLLGTAANITGQFSANTSSTSWIWLFNRISATTVTPSNFGATPSNTFLYQPLPGSYGYGNLTTAVNTESFYEAGSTPTTSSSPYNHSGLVLWTSNTDYLELQVYANGAGGGTNTSHVTVNNSGTLDTTNAVNLNSTTTTGTYNNVWLRFAYSSSGYQPQYSTDGATFTNIGSPIAHAAPFTRTGLNVFTAIANPVTANTASFDFFQSTLGSPTFNQTSYRWFNNADATSPGTALNAVAQNSSTTLTSAGQAFRLRQLIKGAGSIGQSSASFKIQYAQSNTCSSASYSDVTTSSSIAFNDNPTPSDASNITYQSGTDPTDTGQAVNAQTYQESGTFSNSQNWFGNTADGEWDFSLKDNGAPAGTSYCFKAVNSSDGSDIATYTNYPAITTAGNSSPTTDQLMRGGKWFNASGVKQSFFWAQ